MKKATKVLIGSVLVGTSVLTASGAFATSTWKSWSINMPSFGQGVLAASQPKTTVSAAGQLNIGTVALNYKANVRQCGIGVAEPLILNCGTERFNLDDGDYATLPSGNHVAAGHNAWIELHNPTVTTVAVTANGTWRSMFSVGGSGGDRPNHRP